MPCAWLPYTNREIEEARLRRRIHRLEQRLASLRSYHLAAVHSDAIGRIEAELTRLRDQAGGA